MQKHNIKSITTLSPSSGNSSIRMGLSASRSAVTASGKAKVEETHITSNGIHLFDVTVENSGTAGTGDSATSVTTLALIVVAVVVLMILFCLWHQLEACLGCCQPCWQMVTELPGKSESQECRTCRHARRHGLIEEESQEPRHVSLRSEPGFRTSTPVGAYMPEVTYESEVTASRDPRYWTSTCRNQEM